MTLGTEWLIDASGCDPAALSDLDRLRAVFERIIRELDLHVLGEIAWHQFDHPNGVSGLALLSESHLACHTYPEFRAATFNLYCCRNSASWTWEATLKEMLGATEVNVRVLERTNRTERGSAGSTVAKTERGSAGSTVAKTERGSAGSTVIAGAAK